jgi:DNA-binding transcriptional MerR regulator
MDQFDLFGNKMEAPKPLVKKPKVKVEKEKPAPKLTKEESTNATKQKSLGAAPEKKVVLTDKVTEEKSQDKVDEKKLSKVYYTISEVAKMFDVNASLLRFWEKEFKELGKIKKNKKGDRYYNKHNIRSLNIIYYLLKERKMTIAGARNMIKNKRKSTVAEFDMVDNLQKVRGFLVDLKTALQEKN